MKIFIHKKFLGVAEEYQCGCVSGEVIAPPNVQLFFEGESVVEAEADFEAALDLFIEETTLSPHAGVEVTPFTLQYPPDEEGEFDPEVGVEFENGLVAVPYGRLIHLFEKSSLPEGGEFQWGQPVEVDPVPVLSRQYARPAEGQNWRVVYNMIHELVDQFIE